MARVFLSYARDDQAWAERIADALGTAGHEVWWDRHIGAGSSFSREIDEALAKAELVVVLWSRHSVVSDWVRDEASAARDSGRLVPVMIDRVEPPLGFRQYQAVDLTKTGRPEEALVQAVAVRIGRPAATIRPAPSKTRWSKIDSRWPWAAAIIALLVIAGLLWLYVVRGATRPAPVVAVAAAEGGDPRRSVELARAIAADLGRFRAGPLGSLTILGSDRGSRNADYRVEVSVAEAGDKPRIDVSLLSPKESRLLWATSLEGQTANTVDFRQQAVARLGDVLACALEVETYGRDIKIDVLSLYLDGCSKLGDLQGDARDSAALSIFRQVTEKAPDFAPGWGNLAMIESISFPATAPSERRALRRRLDAHLERAKKLDADFPQTIVAEAFALPNDGNRPGRALAVLERGLRVNPDNAHLRATRSLFLRHVGRLNEAVAEAERAMNINPLSESIRDDYISSLAYAGRTSAAFKQLKEAEAIWPGSATLQSVRYRLDLRYGDPRSALRLLEERGSGDVRPVPMDTAWRSFLEARIDPSPSNIERALDSFRARYKRDHGDIPAYLQALGTFGRVDEAYDVVKPAVTLDSMLANTESLFRQHMRSIRSDPRFMALAAKLGLLAYWEKSGVWPDFCGETQLPYDCRAVAAKLTPEQRQVASFIIN